MTSNSLLLLLIYFNLYLVVTNVRSSEHRVGVCVITGHGQAETVTGGEKKKKKIKT